MVSRRQFLAASVMGVVGGGAGFLGAGIPRARAQKSVLKGPRYFVTMFLRGGVDAVYTVDPKSKGDVDAKVDVPYNANDIVDAGGALQLGPHFKPLARWAPKMAVVRGVQVATANHETGAYQVVRMRTGTAANVPSLMDIIGHQRDGQPLASVSLGKLAAFEHSPGALAAPTADPAGGTTSLEAIDEMSDEEAAILAAAYQKHLRHFPSELAGRAAVTRDHVAQAAAFFERMKTTPRFKAQDWGIQGGDEKRASEDMQRTLWLLENDITRGVMVKVMFDWDSHFRNADKQQNANGDFAVLFDKFLDELHTRRNAHGTLAEQTCLVVGSELGRFPVINGNLGKDHFPECPYWMFGPSFNVGATYVPTGKMMEGQKISFKTGKADDVAGDHIFLDDLGTTLMHIAGLEPSLWGYNGRRLEFLERSV